MPGSSMNLASVNTVLNTIVADAISSICERLEKSKNLESDIKKAIRETYLAHKRILFNGDGYSQE
jgi:glutamine synthetase